MLAGSVLGQLLRVDDCVLLPTKRCEAGITDPVSWWGAARYALRCYRTVRLESLGYSRAVGHQMLILYFLTCPCSLKGKNDE